MDDLERERRNAIRRARYAADPIHRAKRLAEANKWKDENRETVREDGRRYQQQRRDSNPDAERQRQEEWRRNNPEKVSEKNKRWFKKFGAEYHRKWAAENRVKNPELYVWRNARNRAKELGRQFSIERSDISIPTICPVLGIPISKQVEGFHPNSPSLDRIDSSRGYVRGNIAVVSWRANCLKRDGTLDEFRKIVAYMESHECNVIQKS